ncbi:MAG: DUF3131 domain-containing protein [Chamaesiphon sp. CSU_1_12]|nr:DUF3131 domain-containing protein [Chamaesiphon sp. CSU_1_12]
MAKIGKTLSPAGKDSDKFRSSSTKTAVSWQMLFRNRYTERNYKGLRWLADPLAVYLAVYMRRIKKSIDRSRSIPTVRFYKLCFTPRSVRCH